MGTKISELPDAGALTGGDELIPIVQDGDTVKTTVQDIADYAGSGATWGSITGTLSSQTDLDTALSGKVPTTRTINGYDLSANRTLTATDVDALKRDGSNANSDVDLGTYSLNTKSVKVNGTAGAGHVGLKHQSSGATATASESVIYADASGNPKWKNDGNAVQSVMLENSAITGATKTKITYDSKGLVTSGADATTADIADSTDKRYVTDAQLTVIGNTSGTNTGDETQSSILSKLGWFTYNRVSESTAVTGTTTETIIENITIPANTYLSGGILRLYNLKIRKVGTVGVTTAMKIYIGPNSNNLTGATLIATYSSLASNIVTIEMLRTFTATTTALLGFGSGSSAAVDTGTGTTARSSTTVDWTANQYIIITIQPASSSDSYTMIGASAKNF